MLSEPGIEGIVINFREITQRKETEQQLQKNESLFMPLMNGKELIDKIRLIIPGQKALFMSGFTDNAIVHQGAGRSYSLHPKALYRRAGCHSNPQVAQLN